MVKTEINYAAALFCIDALSLARSVGEADQQLAVASDEMAFEFPGTTALFCLRSVIGCDDAAGCFETGLAFCFV